MSRSKNHLPKELTHARAKAVGSMGCDSRSRLLAAYVRPHGVYQTHREDIFRRLGKCDSRMLLAF